MRRSLVVFVLMISSVSYAEETARGALTFGSDTANVSISSFSNTQIMINDPYVAKSVIINQSSWTSVCISSFNATLAVSTTTSPQIPTTSVFSLDGPQFPWWGSLWAVVCNAVNGAQPQAQKVTVIRTK